MLNKSNDNNLEKRLEAKINKKVIKCTKTTKAINIYSEKKCRKQSLIHGMQPLCLMN